MSKLNFATKAVIAFLSLAILLGIGLVLSSQIQPTKSEPSTTEQSSSGVSLDRAVEIVSATVAKLGETGWTQVNTSSTETIVFDPSSRLAYQIAAYKTKPKTDAQVYGSIMIEPFDLMRKIEEQSEDYVLYKTEFGFGLKFKDSKLNGTVMTEYEVSKGVLTAMVVRDRIGKKNELNVRTEFFYGLDKAGHKALKYANEHLSFGGHD
jgi:hypothetical protein